MRLQPSPLYCQEIGRCRGIGPCISLFFEQIPPFPSGEGGTKGGWVSNTFMDTWYDGRIMNEHVLALHVSKTNSASVSQLGENAWRLEIPAGSNRHYRLAQLDDHGGRRRSRFRWRPPLIFSLQARVSAENLPGTWGFGLWNDPFSFLLGYSGMVLHLPTLPEAAWFFQASAQNYLSFRNDLPANGLLSATFRSIRVPPLLVDLAAPLLALSLLPGAAQWLRRMLRRAIQQDASQIYAQLTDWHAYRMEWVDNHASFYLDDLPLFTTGVAPHPPLSLVIWIDNQYMAMPPAGRLKYGCLPNAEPAWLEIKDLQIYEKS